jgi:hypothetical protein
MVVADCMVGGRLSITKLVLAKASELFQEESTAVIMIRALLVSIDGSTRS